MIERQGVGPYASTARRAWPHRPGRRGVAGGPRPRCGQALRRPGGGSLALEKDRDLIKGNGWSPGRWSSPSPPRSGSEVPAAAGLRSIRAASARPAPLLLDPLQPVEDQEVRPAALEGIAQEMQKPRSLRGRRCGCGNREVAERLAEKLTGIGLLVEAPDEEPVRACEPAGPRQSREETSRQRRLASALPNPTRARTPPLPCATRLRQSSSSSSARPDELGSWRKRVDDQWARRVTPQWGPLIFIARARPDVRPLEVTPRPKRKP